MHHPCKVIHNDETALLDELLEVSGVTAFTAGKSPNIPSCCGGGGGGFLWDSPAKVNRNRWDDLAATGQKKAVTSCPGCRRMLDVAKSEDAEVTDIANVLVERVYAARAAKAAAAEAAGDDASVGEAEAEGEQLDEWAFWPYSSGVMTRIVLPFALIGAASAGQPIACRDPTAAVEASAAIQLDGLIALVEQPTAHLPLDAQCPMVTKLQEDDAHSISASTAGVSGPGSDHHGRLEHYEGPDGLWLSGPTSKSSRPILVFGLDGAIEVTPSGSLWLVDVAAALCGTQSWTCDDGAGTGPQLHGLPAAGFPDDYDTIMSGTVATERASMTLDGAWSTDRPVRIRAGSVWSQSRRGASRAHPRRRAVLRRLRRLAGVDRRPTDSAA